MSNDEQRVWAIRDRSKAPRQRQLARQMRAAPTQAERKLWWHLRHRLAVPDSHFRRQVRIGRYIVDFACHAKRVVVEVDGGQHGMTLAADAERTRLLEAHRYRVLRYWNNDVLANINGVLEHIQSVITPTPNPSPAGGGLARFRQSNNWPNPGRPGFGWGGERAEIVEAVEFTTPQRGGEP